MYRDMPDFFGGASTKEEWERVRGELIGSFLKEEYGTLPEKITPSIEIKENGVNFAGKAKWEEIYFTFARNGKEHTVKANLILPKDKNNVPVFVSINFQSEVPNKYLPTEEIIDTGFGVFAFCYEDVTTDNNDWDNGLSGLFERDKDTSFGKITLWSYMASACMDYLMTRDEVDKERIGVIGHSRLGKTALLTAVLDERFKIACVNNSGCCGAALSRGKTEENETISKIVEVFPFWFCDRFKKYCGNEEKLPFDQHMLIAAVAPRYVVVGGAVLDVWADNPGQMQSCELAKKAWELYGVPTGRVCYYERQGTHFLSRSDWQVYMAKFNEFLYEEEK